MGMETLTALMAPTLMGAGMGLISGGGRGALQGATMGGLGSMMMGGLGSLMNGTGFGLSPTMPNANKMMWDLASPAQVSAGAGFSNLSPANAYSTMAPLPPQTPSFNPVPSARQQMQQVMPTLPLGGGLTNSLGGISGPTSLFDYYRR